MCYTLHDVNWVPQVRMRRTDIPENRRMTHGAGSPLAHAGRPYTNPVTVVDTGKVEQRGRPPVDMSRTRALADGEGPALSKPMIDAPELNAMRAAEAAREAELDTLIERDKRRLCIYIAISCVSFPLAHGILITGSFTGLWLQVPLAAAHGAYVGLMRPCVMLSVVATLAVGILMLIHIGAQSHFRTLLAIILYCAAGAALGSREGGRPLDR